MNAYLNILHLTDIHLLPAGDFNQSLLLDATLASVGSHRGTRLQPNLIVVSGDLARAADDKEAYTRFLDFLLKVGSAVGLTEEKIVLCPGNHDVSRSVTGSRLPEVQRWQELATSRDAANGLTRDGKYTDYVHKTFSEYNSLAQNFSREAHIQSGFSFETFFYRDLSLAVVSINTATLSTGGLIKGTSDLGKLVVPEAVLVEALRNVPGGSHTIVVGHHPTTWLNEINQDVIDRLLSAHANMYLCGHLHAARPKQVTTSKGTCFIGQSGALYEHRDRWNGYVIHSVVPGKEHVRSSHFRWYEERREFGKSEDLELNGVTHSTPEAKPFFDNLRPPLDRTLLDRWRVDHLIDAIKPECSQSLSPIPLDDSFVAPEFIKETPPTSEDGGKLSSKIDIVTFEKAISSDGNLLISAPEQSGKSTMLRRWAYLEANSSALASTWNVPVIVDFTDIREYPAYIETLINRKLPNLPEDLTTRVLLGHGAVTVLVDGYDFKKKQQVDALNAFMSLHPACRYILATSSSILEGSAWEPIISPELPFTHMRLRQLRRRQLLSLIRGHGIADPQQADQLLDRVMREAESLSVPLTAVTGSFLIQVFNTEPDRVLVNQATLVERYIELLLQKFTRPEIELKSFDFKLKRDLLAVFAEKMCSGDNYAPSYNEVLGWTLAYINHYGFPQPAHQVLEHFIHCRILEKVNGGDEVRLRFSLTTFQSYFVAWRMIESQSFRSWVFDAERYLSYMDEVSFYAALVRNDLTAVRFIFDEFEKLSEEMWVDASEAVRSGSFMDDFVEPRSEASEEEVFAMQEVIRSNEQTDAERAHLLESDAGEMRPSQRVNRPDYDTVGDKWYGHLALCSMVLKHMELISHSDKKELLAQIVTSWLQFCTLSIGLVPQLARDKSVTLNGVTYKLTMRGDVPIGETSRRLSLAMPLAVSHIATGMMGSEKLQLQLKEGLGGDKLSPSEQLMRALLLADIGAAGLGEIMRAAADGIKGRRYLTNVLARKLYDVAIRFRLEDKDLEQVRQLAGELLVKLEGKKPSLGPGRKNQIIADLRGQRVLAQLVDRTER